MMNILLYFGYIVIEHTYIYLSNCSRQFIYKVFYERLRKIENKIVE